jgi:hypothetical protein
MSDKSEDESVLGSLPATRPTRFGGERPKSGEAKATPTAAKPRAKAKPKAAKRPASTPRRKPRPVRAGAPALAESTKRARAAEPPPEPTSSPPSGTELVTTAIQAAGELAQIGLAVGGQMLKRAVDKLPKP